MSIHRRRCDLLFLSLSGLIKKNIMIRTISNAGHKIKSNVTEAQIAQLEDKVIVVDSDDNIVSAGTKRECHQLSGNTIGLLHRAFSVFLFNSKNELLLQQRSASKITFPNYYTNTCCSHQRYTEDEMQENDNYGTRNAAQRRMFYELGIPNSSLPVDAFKVLTKIHYSAKADEQWGEHELDHVLICKTDVDLSNVNTDEVKHTMFLDAEGLRKFLSSANENGILITPWFKYISETFLFKWWENLDDLDQFKDNLIHRAGDQSS